MALPVSSQAVHRVLAGAIEGSRGVVAERLDVALATSWIEKAARPFAVRRRLGAGEELALDAMRAGDAVHLVESGALLLRRPIARATGRARVAVRLLGPGELLTWSCAALPQVDCFAVTATLLLRIDRRWLERQARLDPVLAQRLRAVHADELGWLLGDLGRPAVPDRPPDTAVTSSERR